MNEAIEAANKNVKKILVKMPTPKKIGMSYYLLHSVLIALLSKHPPMLAIIHLGMGWKPYCQLKLKYHLSKY